MTQSPAAEVAAHHGLVSASATPPPRAYLAETWRRRDLIRELALARSTAQYSDSLLGRVWQVVTPILNAGIYYVIFGVLLGTKRGIENYPAFLIAGVFAFNYMQATITASEACIPRNGKLVEGFRFPKLVLPLATALEQLQQYLVALGVLAVAVLFTGEPITLTWLLLPVVITMQVMFVTGVSLVMARIGAKARDLSQLMPFFTRTWRYMSGVFFSISVFAAKLPQWGQAVLTYNPGAVFIDLVRDALMRSHAAGASIWVAGVLWAVGSLALGLRVFYRGEGNYG